MKYSIGVPGEGDGVFIARPSADSETVSATRNNDLSLACPVTYNVTALGPASYAWRKDGQPIDTETRRVQVLHIVDWLIWSVVG